MIWLYVSQINFSIGCLAEKYYSTLVLDPFDIFSKVIVFDVLDIFQ